MIFKHGVCNRHMQDFVLRGQFQRLAASDQSAGTDVHMQIITELSTERKKEKTATERRSNGIM